jgi:transcriptional regulator with XRE-family HTH domain
MKPRLDIINARKALGMTQKELAKHIGISRRSLSKLENGITRPRLVTETVLREVLGLGQAEDVRGIRKSKPGSDGKRVQDMDRDS